MEVVSLSKESTHKFSKSTFGSMNFLKGFGVAGDAHCGQCVKHRSRVKVDPTQPNLRQVHLIHFELIFQLQQAGFSVGSGSTGESVLIAGLDLLSLPQESTLKLGSQVVLKITGLRNPCAQLDNYQSGLTKAVLDKDLEGNLIRKAGIMAIVEEGGHVRVDDKISIQIPSEPHKFLERV